MDANFFQNDVEKGQHEDAIDRLCQQHPDHCKYIRDTYLQTLQPLIGKASIRTYLAILVTRKVEALLSKH